MILLGQRLTCGHRGVGVAHNVKKNEKKREIMPRPVCSCFVIEKRREKKRSFNSVLFCLAVLKRSYRERDVHTADMMLEKWERERERM